MTTGISTTDFLNFKIPDYYWITGTSFNLNSNYHFVHSDGNLHIVLYAAGLSKDDIKIKFNITNNLLVVEGSKEVFKNSHPISVSTQHQVKVSPDLYDISNISAKADNGLFYIIVPKRKSEKEKVKVTWMD